MRFNIHPRAAEEHLRGTRRAPTARGWKIPLEVERMTRMGLGVKRIAGAVAALALGMAALSPLGCATSGDGWRRKLCRSPARVPIAEWRHSPTAISPS